MKREKLKLHRHRVHKRIHIKVWMYAVIFIITLGISIFHLMHDSVSWWMVMAGFVAGVLLGFIASRMQKITWDKKNEQIIMQMDVTGIIILVFYIVLAIFRSTIITGLTHLPVIAAITFAVMSGVMFGRIVRIRTIVIKKLKVYLNEENDFESGS